MLTLNMLGHVYLTQGAQNLHLSSKGTALISYLTLERQAHHREHLADLLWDNPQCLRNLRVELTRLKQQGISAFPARQPMLSLACRTDLDAWQQDAAQVSEHNLSDWLGRLRGFPLSGLEDIGSLSFQEWLEGQRGRITDELERTLAAVYTRLQQQGKARSLALLRERAERFGLNLPEDLPPLPPGAADAPLLATPALFRNPALEDTLRQLAQVTLTEQRTHAVFLHGTTGTHRPLLEQTLRNGPWQLLHLHLSAQRRLMQGALIQQLARALPQYRAELLRVLDQLTEAGELDLLRVSTLMAQSGQPLVIAVHADHVEPWFINALRFALDFPHPLLLVVCSTSRAVLTQTQVQLGFMDAAQQHPLSIPPLSSGALQRHLQTHERAAACTFAQAARLAQCSEGWPLYAQALYQALYPQMLGDLSRLSPHPTPGEALPEQGHCPRQPATVTAALLAELSHVPPPVTAALARLAQVQDRFSAALAAQVMNLNSEHSLSVLAFARSAGLLVAAADVETVQLPALTTRLSDAEPLMAFSSEALRAALASQVPPPERHDIRAALGRLHQQPHPPAVHSTLPALPSPLALRPAASLEFPTQALRTANGYRLHLEDGHLTLLRKGWPGAAPQLNLSFGQYSAGTWHLSVRADVYRNLLSAGGHYALGINRQGQAAARFRPQVDPSTPPQDDLLFPAGQWVKLQGEHPGGPFELSVQAMDIALCLRDLNVNGLNLLEPTRQTARLLN